MTDLASLLDVAEALVSERLARLGVTVKGDLPGHEFHGNQWTEGSGGGGESEDSGGEKVGHFEERARHITTHEETLIILPNGQSIEKSGGDRSVKFTNDELDSIEKNSNAVLTHNHPIVASLSDGDIKFAAYYNMAEVRAVDSKYTYSLVRPSDGWPDPGKMAGTWKREFNKQVKSIRGRVSSHELTSADATEIVTHLSTVAVSEKYGIKYERNKT